MNAVSEDDAEPQRRFLSDLKPLDPFPRIRIEPTEREVGCRFGVEEGIHLGQESVELLFGPVELLYGSV